MLCDSCHKNEATCHVCTIVNGVSQSRDLCIECHEASSPQARAFSETARNARCQYCGGQPCAGGTDLFAMITGSQKLKFMCVPCSREHNRFVQGRLEHCPPEFGQQDQLAYLRKLDKEADEHMKRWVSDRSSQ